MTHPSRKKKNQERKHVKYEILRKTSQAQWGHIKNGLWQDKISL